MVTKGIIKKIPANNLIAPDYKFDVRIPIFEPAGSKEEYILTGCLCYTNEEVSSYKLGDIVYVGFEDNNLNKPVILGKLWCEKNNGEKIPLNIETISSLKITDLAFLPEDTNYKGTNLDEYIKSLLSTKQDILVSGQNIKTINNQSLLGPGNIDIGGGSVSAVWGNITGVLSDQTDLQQALDTKLELYEIQQSDIESVQGNRYILTKDLTDKITSGKYLLKINSNLFEEEPDPDNYTELLLKPAFNLKSEWLPQEGIDKVYEFETISTFFDTGITLAIFAYNETLDRCIFDTTTSQKSITIPIGLQTDTTNNSIKLYSGDVGYGDEAYLATINNQPIVGGGNIDTPNDNDYHEPRFSSGLSIASSSNLSEMYVPYATSSTYGVLRDIYYPSSNPSNFASQGYVDTIAIYTYNSAISYVSSVLSSYATQSYAETVAYYAYSSAVAYTDSKLSSYATQLYADNVAYLAGSTAYASAVSYVDSNFLPLSGGTLTGSLNAGSNAIYAETIGVPDGNGGLSAGWYWNGEASTYTLNNNVGPVEILVSTYLRDTYVYGSLYYGGAEVATVNDLSAYVPYVSATSDVNLNSHALSGITNLSATNITATSVINGKILNLSKHSPVDHDATVTIVPHWRQMSEDEAGITFSANGGEYKFTAYDEDEENHTATVRFDATSDHMYYFPDKDGTLALTDDLPSVYNESLTITLDSSSIGSFTANASSSTTINIDLSGYLSTNSYINQSKLNDELYYWGSSIYAQAVSDAESFTKGYVSGDYNSAFWTSIQIGSISRAIPAPFNSALNLSLDGVSIGTYYPSSGATINIDLSASGYNKVIANPVLATTDTLNNIYIGGVNYALPGATGTFVPYNGASQTVNLSGQNLISVGTLTASGFYIYGTSYAGIDYNNSISKMTVGNYHGSMAVYARGDLTLETANDNNIVLLPDGLAYYGGTAPSDEIATLGDIASIQNAVPYSGATQNVNLGTHTLTASDITGNNIIANGYIKVNDDGQALSSAPRPIDNLHYGDADVVLYGTGITIYDYDNSAYTQLAYPSSGGTLATEQWVASQSYATESYVDNRHTMYNTDSLSDANIDRILIAGGVVILEDSSPLLDLSLAMTPTLINNNQGLNLNMINSINNNDSIGDKGLSLTIENSIN